MLGQIKTVERPGKWQYGYHDDSIPVLTVETLWGKVICECRSPPCSCTHFCNRQTWSKNGPRPTWPRREFEEEYLKIKHQNPSMSSAKIGHIVADRMRLLFDEHGNRRPMGYGAIHGMIKAKAVRKVRNYAKRHKFAHQFSIFHSIPEDLLDIRRYNVSLLSVLNMCQIRVKFV